MSQFIQDDQYKITLTGNPFVDNGLATIAALCNCRRIEDLTLQMIKDLHHLSPDLGRCGESLFLRNMRLIANGMVFTNSITQQPSYSAEDKLQKYCRIMTAIVNRIGRENKGESCDFCGNPYSLDFDKLVKIVSDKNNGIGRDWFPLCGSFKDAQCLPSASRSLNACAKCLFAVQYLPQSALLIDGHLTLFQATSVEFWYNFVSRMTRNVDVKLGMSAGKIEIVGKKEGSRDAIVKLLDIMKTSQRRDPNSSMTMYQFSNSKGGALKKRLIPNSALNFLWTASKKGLTKDVEELTLWEIRKKLSYKYSLFNKILTGEDYAQLYPELEKKKNKKKGKEEKELPNGASPDLYLLYQTTIMGYPAQLLRTTYNIAEFVKSQVEDRRVGTLSVDIEKDRKKQIQIERWIIKMAREGAITFDEYYNLFMRSDSDNRNRWWLIKYYLRNTKEIKFKDVEDTIIESLSEYKDKVVKVDNMIVDRILQKKGLYYIQQKLSVQFAKGVIGRDWLKTQFEALADDNTDFDYDDNWDAVCTDENGQEDIYRFLYLLRLLFTTRIYKDTTSSKVDAIKV